MAKAPKKPLDSASPSGDADVSRRAKSAKMLLLAAVLLSAASLGGGFFLARMAYQEDAQKYALEGTEDYLGEDGHSGGEYGHDTAGTDGHEADGGHGAKNEDGSGKDHGTEPTDEGSQVEGMLIFNDIQTNINGFDIQGRPTRFFVKMALVLVYDPEPGAMELMVARQPFMRDLFNGYLRGLTESDLRGTAGLLNVKSELLKRARAAAGNDLPSEVLISDLIVQ